MGTEKSANMAVAHYLTITIIIIIFIFFDLATIILQALQLTVNLWEEAASLKATVRTLDGVRRSAAEASKRVHEDLNLLCVAKEEADRKGASCLSNWLKLKGNWWKPRRCWRTLKPLKL